MSTHASTHTQTDTHTHTQTHKHTCTHANTWFYFSTAEWLCLNYSFYLFVWGGKLILATWQPSLMWHLLSGSQHMHKNTHPHRHDTHADMTDIDKVHSYRNALAYPWWHLCTPIHSHTGYTLMTTVFISLLTRITTFAMWPISYTWCFQTLSLSLVLCPLSEVCLSPDNWFDIQ